MNVHNITKIEPLIKSADSMSVSYFVLLPEYFLAICLIYSLIVFSVVTQKALADPDDDYDYQKPFSNCLGIVCLMACYIVLNETSVYFFFPLLNKTTFNDSLSVFSKSFLCLFSSFFFFFFFVTLKN